MSVSGERFRTAKGILLRSTGAPAMSFQILALDPSPFAKLFGLSDADLRERNAVRMAVTEEPGFPCRVGLRDMPVGASALLLNWRHQDAASPYMANGPIFVEEGVTAAATLAPDEIPDVLRRRLLSLRAYDANGMMIDAEVVEGQEAGSLIARLFDNPHTNETHVHFARRGCYAARIVRA
jgi:Protein of unknown function (DUF1203)